MDLFQKLFALSFYLPFSLSRMAKQKKVFALLSNLLALREEQMKFYLYDDFFHSNSQRYFVKRSTQIKGKSSIGMEKNSILNINYV